MAIGEGDLMGDFEDHVRMAGDLRRLGPQYDWTWSVLRALEALVRERASTARTIGAAARALTAPGGIYAGLMDGYKAPPITISHWGMFDA